ncbi:9616_t:CDS:1, partial [Paraglomus occultum]
RYVPPARRSLSDQGRGSVSSQDRGSVSRRELVREVRLMREVRSISCAKKTAGTRPVDFDPKLVEIEILYKFISFQSFDGFFKPTAKLSSFFSRGKDKNLFQNKDQDSVWSTCIALAYFDIVMKDFKEEWELCYEKAQTALNESSGYDSSVLEKMLQDARKWVTDNIK